MRVRDVMTHRPACCHRDTTVQEAARAMLTHDCGSLPVIDREHPDRVIGVVTDRDIATRAVAAGRDPAKLRVEEIMSHPVVAVEELCSVDDCIKTLEKNRVRRLPVVDQTGKVVGMVSQADIARICDEKHVGEMVRGVSQGVDIGHR